MLPNPGWPAKLNTIPLPQLALTKSQLADAGPLLSHQPSGDDASIHAQIANFLAEMPPAVHKAMSYAALLVSRNPADASSWCVLGEALDLLPDEERPAWLDTAIFCFQQAINLNPTESLAAYWYLAQASDGRQALDYYTALKKILVQRIEMAMAETASQQKESGPDLEELKKQYADTCTALAEMYMTDLCDEEEAEMECVGNIKSALDCQADHIPALVQKCAYLTVMEKIDQARHVAKELMMHLDRCIKAYSDEEEGDLDCLPDFEVILNFARISTDIGMAKEAIRLLCFLNHLQEHDDRVWHRLSLAYMLDGERECAKNCVERAISIRNAAGGDKELMGELEALRQHLDAPGEQSHGGEHSVSDKAFGETKFP